MFDTTNAFIIENEVDWKRRKTKEAIYSIVNQSINKHNEIDPGWLSIITKNSELIKKKIKMTKLRWPSIKQRQQDGYSGTDEKKIT